MKEDNITQLGDYDAPFCEQQYRHGSCYISLSKFKSFDQFNTPQTASNFRHLLSCGTIVMTFTEIDPSQTSKSSRRSCKHGGHLLEVAVGWICQRIQAHRRSGMSKK